MIFIINTCTNCTVTRVNPMFYRSILPVLIAFSTAVPALATPGPGLWYRGTYYEGGPFDTALCESVADELEEGVDLGYFSEDYAEYVLEGCLNWSDS